MNVKKSTAFLAGIGLMASVVACQKSYVDPGVAAITKADSIIQAYIKSNNLSVNQNSAGVYYAVTKTNSTGKTPVTGEEVAFLYNAVRLDSAKLVDPTQKDTTIYIPMGAAGLNTSLQEVLRVMHVGETASLFLYNAQPVLNSSNAVILAAYKPYMGTVNLVASRTEDEQIDKYVADNKLTVNQKTTTGLRFIKTLDNPSGGAITNGQSVTVKYSGYMIHGTVPFDPGTTPLVFTVGQNKVVPGFEEGVRLLKVGEKARIVFPSSQGYGSAGVLQSNVYVILPYAPLIFNIEIVSAQ